MSLAPNKTDPVVPLHQRWTLDDIPWPAIQNKSVVHEEYLFYLIATASFIKSATEPYARNLARHFSGDADVCNWLEQCWWFEELHHGLALKRYIQAVWPEFDWDSVYEYFFKEFAVARRDGDTSSSKSLEIVSCCVLEMANAGYFTALGDLTDEPVLKLLVQRIGEDETRHYQQFYDYYCRYRQAEDIRHPQVLQTVRQGLRLLNNDDAVIVMKHVYGACHPDEPFSGRECRQMQRFCRHLVAHHFPREGSAGTVPEPREFGARTRSTPRPTMRQVAQRFMT